MKKGKTFGRWRRLAGALQAASFLGLPFLRVNGESALRLDVGAGRLHAFGASFAIEEAFVVLAAVLFATFVFLLATLLLGRAWCGWSCPQTVLSDLTAWVMPAPERRAHSRRWRRPLGFAAVAAISAVFSAGFLWYFVPPGSFLARAAAGRLGPTLSASWALLGAALFLDLAFVRQTFCATVCPYARLQGVLLDRASLVVAYDRTRAADCVDCGACVRVCPTGIDIRDGLQMQCIACAECVDACQPIMRKLGRAPDLVGYFFGGPPPPGQGEPTTGPARRILRPAALALAAATALSGALLAGVLARRAPLELEAHAEHGFAPRRGADGRALNLLAVELENRTRAPMEIALAVEVDGSPGAAIAVRPDRVQLAPGERRHLRLLAAAGGLPPGRVRARLAAEVREGDRLLVREDAEVSLVVPEVP
jgi:cytochrome c oxidase accessory protein FixG